MMFRSLAVIVHEDLVVRRKLLSEDPKNWNAACFYPKMGERGLFLNIPLPDLETELVYQIEVVDNYLRVTSRVSEDFFKRLFSGRSNVETFRLDCRGFNPREVLDDWADNFNEYEDRLLVSPTHGSSECKWPNNENKELLIGTELRDDWVLIPKFKGIKANIAAADEILKAGRKLQVQTTEFGKVVWLQYLLWAFMYLYTQSTTDLQRLVLRQLLEKVLGLELKLDYSDEVYHLSVGREGVLQYAFRDTELNYNKPDRVFGFIRASLYGTLVSERSIEQRFTQEFHELFALLGSSDCNVIPWSQLPKSSSGETDLDVVVQVQPEYNLLKELK